MEIPNTYRTRNFLSRVSCRSGTDSRPIFFSLSTNQPKPNHENTTPIDGSVCRGFHKLFPTAPKAHYTTRAREILFVWKRRSARQFARHSNLPLSLPELSQSRGSSLFHVGLRPTLANVFSQMVFFEIVQYCGSSFFQYERRRRRHAPRQSLLLFQLWLLRRHELPRNLTVARTQHVVVVRSVFGRRPNGLWGCHSHVPRRTSGLVLH